MKTFLRYLRIAFSTTCLIACVLLIVLWVRSYWRADLLHCPLQSPRIILFQSCDGRMEVFLGRPSPSQKLGLPSGLAIDSIEVKTIVPPETPEPHWDFTSNKRFTAAEFPHWCLAFMLASLAVVPWIRYRFSLRTLLIATTLVAVVLGLIVWQARR